MTATASDEFERLLEFIRDERGFDFTGYKRPSLIRRVRRRMSDHRLEGYDEYRQLLARDSTEFAQLFDTILINVTGFFRDGDVWAYLRDEIVPRIVDARGDDEPIRVWSTGCASGEEAYTVGILFAEALGEASFRNRVKIYATDVDEDALNHGRHGIYTPKSIVDVPEELRDRYFEQSDSRFTFKKELRRNVIFGRHDLIKDPPISRVDLLVSRNTLMYFEADTQRRILAGFHFSLRPEGYLFLGKSEVLVTRTNLFAPVDLKQRVFAPLPRATARDRISAARDYLAELPRRAPAPVPEDVLERAFDAAPVAHIVVDAGGRLARANHQARATFGLAQHDVGKLLQDLEVSYRPLELRSEIEKAHAERHTVSVHDVAFGIGPGVRTFDVHVSPLWDDQGQSVGAAVSYTDATRLRRLEDELGVARRDVDTAHEELQSAVEELETTNEELQSTNEELETTNEELQSTNEELETMNEELQSTNEELETMNDELRLRTDEVNQANAFLETIMASLGAAVVVVDGDLCVQVWNRRAEDLWGLRVDEVRGQHLMNLDFGLPLEHLHRPLRAALAGEEPDVVAVEAVNRRGRRIRCTIRATPLEADGSAGAILVMEDEHLDA